jgi:hypothetical protein
MGRFLKNEGRSDPRGTLKVWISFETTAADCVSSPCELPIQRGTTVAERDRVQPREHANMLVYSDVGETPGSLESPSDEHCKDGVV